MDKVMSLGPLVHLPRMVPQPIATNQDLSLDFHVLFLRQGVLLSLSRHLINLYLDI